MKRSFAAAGALALALATAAGCSSADRQTQITLALSTETKVPEELDAFVLQVINTKTGDLRFSQTYYPTSGNDFPTTLAVIPIDEDSLASPLRVELQGLRGSEVFLRREAVISYFKGRNLLLTMPLKMACFQFKDCGAGSTCAGGQCVDSTVTPSALPDYASRYVFGKDNADCFDEQACLPGGVEVQVDADCTFPIPAGAATGQGNVSIRWAAAPSRILSLDEGDLQQGWTRLSDGRGQLSQGACDSHFQKTGADGKLLVADWAEKVYFTSACATKSALVPYCFSQTTGHAGIGALSP